MASLNVILADEINGFASSHEMFLSLLRPYARTAKESAEES